MLEVLGIMSYNSFTHLLQEAGIRSASVSIQTDAYSDAFESEPGYSQGGADSIPDELGHSASAQSISEGDQVTLGDIFLGNGHTR